MRVLITGGAGYIGSVLCEHLLAAGHQVTVLEKFVHRQPSLLHLCANPALQVEVGDARDAGTLTRLLRTADAVVPLAAVVGAPACAEDPDLATTLNLGAVQTLMRLRSRDQLVVYPTTNSGYGTRSGDVYCTEDTPLEPVSHYGRTKVDAERCVLDHENTLTFRLATVFGLSPRLRLDLMVNHFVWAATTDGFLVLFESHFRRNFLHVRDAADCFVHALANPERMVGRAYNVGRDQDNVSKRELAELVKRHVPSFFIHYAEIGTDPDKRDYIVSNQRLREAGFEAQRGLDAGVDELIKGYRMFRGGPMRNV